MLQRDIDARNEFEVEGHDAIHSAGRYKKTQLHL